MISNLVFWGAGLAIITSTNQNSCYSPSRFCQIMRISWLPFIIFPEIIPLSMNKLTTRNDCFEKRVQTEKPFVRFTDLHFDLDYLECNDCESQLISSEIRSRHALLSVNRQTLYK